MSDMVYEFSVGFQEKILALLMRNKNVYVSYGEIIKPHYFQQSIHIDLARIIKNYYKNEVIRAQVGGRDITPPTLDVLFEEIRKLTSKNKQKAVLVEQYQDCVLDMLEIDLSDEDYVKESLIEFGKNAAMKRAILDSVDDLKSLDYSKIEQRVSEAMQVGENVEDLGSNYFETAARRIEEYNQGEDGVERIPTGLAGVDKAMNGGLGRGELGVIIAPPNRGKSIALINIGAGAVLNGHCVVHYTLEMPERQVEKRYDNKFTKKPLEFLQEKPNETLQAILNLQKYKKGDLYVKRYRTNACTVSTLRSHLTQLQIRHGVTPDVIIVDYADLLSPERTYKDKRYELESIYLALRDLGAEFNCAIWTASQTNRGALDKKVITIADLAEAFNKANIADFMAALCQTPEEKDNGEMRVHIAKHRDGEANITLNGDIAYNTMDLTVYER